MALLYLASIVWTLWILFQCSMTEPGIIPKLKSKNVQETRIYKVVYDFDADNSA